MTSTSTDRIAGARSSLAIKAPCVAATTANIVLSALQTIDAVVLAAGDRVLVKNQASGVNNGIYVVDTGTWIRAPDADGNADWTSGTLINVTGGTLNTGFWQMTTAGTIIVGTTSIAFVSAQVGLATVSAFMQTVLNTASATTAATAFLAAGISMTGDISPAALAGNTDDWAPVGFATASTIRMDLTAAWNLTGITAGTDGRLICLHNISAFAATLKNNVTSIAGNRFQLNGDYTLNANSSVVLEYDSTSSRWRLFGQQGTTSISTSVSFNRLVNNVGLTITMAANAATIALKGADGNDPSGSNTCTIGIRSGTITLGTVNQRTVQAALSTVISSGSTGGTVSGQISRIWIAGIDVGGVIELAWYQSVSGTNIKNFDEGGVISTTAEGGAGAADSAQTWYSTTARASVAFTILGYFESTQNVAGTWASAATTIVVNPAVRPGMIMQSLRTSTTAIVTCNTNIPFDNTIPQNTEGTQVLTQSITPTSGANVIRVEFGGWGSTVGSGSNMTASLIQDATANALAAAASQFGATSAIGPIFLRHEFVGNIIVATSMNIRVGNSAATVTINADTTPTQLYGGRASTWENVTEISV